MRILRAIVEFLLLALGSILAGFLIASIVHFLSFGIWGYGFGKDAEEMALFEGGGIGVLAAVPTGVIIYYGVLKRRVDTKEVTLILIGSLVGGLILGAATFVLASILIPIWTIAVAIHLKRRSARKEPMPWVA